MDLSEIQWRATEWIIAFGGLNEETVMEYFYLSPFYDQTSNNAVLRMQTQYSGNVLSPLEERNELAKLTGLEFILLHAAHNYYIIQSQTRIDPNTVTAIDNFYVLNDSIYKANSLYNVINQRLLTTIHSLQSTFTTLTKHKPVYSQLSTNSRFNVKPSTLTTAAPEAAVAPVETDAIEAEISLKRAREEDDDTTLFPTNSFNPILFRAITTIAPTILPPPAPVVVQPPPDIVVPEIVPAEEVVKAAATTRKGPNRVDAIFEEKEAGVAGGTEARKSASGKRKPRKAA